MTASSTTKSTTKLTTAKKKAFLEQRLKRKQNGSTRPNLSIPPRSGTGPAPLSYVQEGVWYLEQLQPDVATYNMALAWRLQGTLNVPALEQSLNALIRRHESLRTSFQMAESQPVQVIKSELRLSLPVVDLQPLPTLQQERRARARIEEESYKPFDLTQAPLIRATLLRLASDEHIFILAMHHIISDGWSLGIFNRELSAYYAAFSKQQPEPLLPDLPIQYADFATWQREHLQGEILEKYLAYWRKQLNDAPPVLELPTDYARPATQSYKGDRVEIKLPNALVKELKRLSSEHNLTLFITLITAFKVLLHRYTGQDSIVVGTPMVNRNRVEIENLIGYFLNNLALRADLADNPTFRELLKRVRATTLEAYHHQELSFEKLVQELQPYRDLSYTPIFQVFFNMFLGEGEFELADITVERMTKDNMEAGSKFDLTLYVRRQSGEVCLNLVYKTSLFRRERMIEFLAQYEQLLRQVAESPDRRIAEFSLVTSQARQFLPDPTILLSNHWEGAVHTQFSKQAKRQPTQIAVIDPHDQWTYQTLEERSNQLAHYLMAKGIQPGDVVAIYGHRSAGLVWAWLGILKAGAAFVNLDPAYPTDRLIHYWEVSQPVGFVVIEAAGSLPVEIADLAKSLACCVTLPRLAEPNPVTAQPMTPPAVRVGPDDTAYIAFTSGSIGQPKGVRGRHGPLSHFLPWQTKAFDLTATDRFSMLSGLSHDPLQRDIFTAMWAGATICIPDPDLIGVPGYLAGWMKRERITFAHMTPPMCQILTETAQTGCTLSQLRYAFFVGDKLTRQNVTQLRAIAPHATCINSYGSTETQRAVSYHLLPPDATESSSHQSKGVYPLGRGMPDVQLLVLNKNQQLAGVGEVGEIYMRSPHLAGGYVGDEALTEARFVANPFTGIERDRLYRTGDLGRYRPDGTVEFAGRADRQIKIRGFRIEPGEIEYALAQHPQIRQAVVMARDDFLGGHSLVAYLVMSSTSDISMEDVRHYLKQRFPEYMVPVAFVKVDELPLTPNGKINYRILPAPQASELKSKGSSVAPRNEIEQQLVHLWQQLLERGSIRIHDNFFELGGHSLLAICLFTQIEQKFGKKLPLTILFQSPTVAGLSKIIQQNDTTVDESIVVPIQPGDSRPPLFCVHGFGGGVVGYGELARLLGPEQPVYGLQAKGIDGVEEPDEEVEIMATRYIKAIRNVQPRGPYFVGGYCYGGVIAFEMARQLEAQGEKAALVAVFEGYAPLRGGNRDSIWRNPRLMLNFVQNMPYWLSDYLALGREQMRLRLSRKIRRHWKRLIRKFGVPITWDAKDVVDDTSHIPAKQRQLMQTHIRAMSKYDPGLYKGPVTLFRIRSQSLSRTPDPTMGWNKLAAGGVEIKRIAGSHHNILEQPFVQTLANQLQSSLEQARAGHDTIP